MPAASSPPAAPGRALSRRAALLTVAAVTTTACSPYSLQTQKRRARQTPTARPTPTADPDVDLAAAVLAAEQTMLDRVVATLERHPTLAPALASARTAHQAHVDLLVDAAPQRVAPEDGTSDATRRPGPSRIPRDPGRALRLLAGHEDDLALSNRRAAFAAQSGAFARVLASIAAAAAQQSAVLRRTLSGRSAR